MLEGSFPLSFPILALSLSLFSRHLSESSPESLSSDHPLHLYTDVDVVFLHCYRLSVSLPQT